MTLPKVTLESRWINEFTMRYYLHKRNQSEETAADTSYHKRCTKARATDTYTVDSVVSVSYNSRCKAAEVSKWPILLVRSLHTASSLCVCKCKCMLGRAAVRLSRLSGARFHSSSDWKVVTSGFKLVMSCHPNASWRWRPGRLSTPNVSCF